MHRAPNAGYCVQHEESSIRYPNFITEYRVPCAESLLFVRFFSKLVGVN